MLGRLAGRAIRLHLVARRSVSNASGPKKTSLWPWVIGTGLVGGSGYFFFRNSSDPAQSSDPIKAASDIINVPYNDKSITSHMY